MTLCSKCKRRPVIETELKSSKLSKYCSVCILNAVISIPNLDCEYCLGTGEYYWHSEDCTDDDCSLTGGYHDCQGQIIKCDCSVLEGIADEAIDIISQQRG